MSHNDPPEALFIIDRSDEAAIQAVTDLHLETVQTQPLNADFSTLLTLVSSLTAAIKLVTVLIERRKAAAKNIVRINGVEYKLLPENRDQIIKALEEHLRG